MNLNVVCEPVSDDAFWITDIMDGIVRESVKKGLNVTALTDGVLDRDALSRLSEDESGCRPALVTGYSLPWLNQTLETLTAGGVEPILVSVGAQRHRGEFSSVSFNTSEAVRQLVVYLHRAGRRRIAFFGLHKNTVGDMAKLAGYADGLREIGERFFADRVFARGGIADCASRLVARAGEFDAVICANDLFALYLLRSLASHGVRVPDDLYVTGFGNWRSLTFAKPSLTRMYTDLGELGCQAVRLHQYMQYNPLVRHSSSVIECTLEIGESTGGAAFRGEGLTGPVLLPAHGNSPLYSEDADLMEVLRAELFLRGTDATDRALLAKLAEHEKYPVIAEQLAVSESTIKYRIGKLLRLGRFSDRAALLDFAARAGLTGQS